MEVLVTIAVLAVAIACYMLYRQGGGRLATLGLGLVAASSLVWAALPSTSATASNPINLTITPVDLNPANEVALEGSTYTNAKNTLTSPANTSATIIVALVGLPPMNIASAAVTTDDTARSMSLVGTGEVMGINGATIALTATWPSNVSTDPDVAVFVRFNSISLNDLNPDWPADMDITFGPAILGMATSNHTVDPAVTPGMASFLSDGIGATDDAFPVVAGSLNMQAAIASGGGGPIGDSTEELGGDGDGVRIRGVLSASVGLLDETDATPPTIGLDLTFDFTVATPASFPDWIELNSPWTLGLSIDNEGNFEASFTGGATVKPDGETEVDVTGTIEVSVSNGGNDITLGVTLEIGEYPNLFGQDWLDLNGAVVTAELTSSGGAFSFSGGIEAGITIGPVVTELSIQLSVGGGTTEAVIDAAIVEPVSVGDILEAIGSPTGANATLESLTLNAGAIHVEIVSATGSPTEVVFSIFASASIDVNGASAGGVFQADVLFRMSKGAEPQADLLVAARIDSPNLADLVEGGFDWDLPDVALIASTAERTDNSADLDPPTFAYFAPVYCEGWVMGDPCDFDLEVQQGLMIQAFVELPQDMKDALSELGVNVTSPLIITGRLPVLGSTTLSLEVILPAVDNGGNTPETGGDELVQSAEISFFITMDTVTKIWEAGIEGSMVFRITRSDQGTCTSVTNPPDGEYPTGGDCYDTVNLDVTASILISLEGVEIQLQGTISEWDNAFGQEWLDIQEFTLQLGIEIAPPSGVTLEIGILGRLKFGVEPNTKDLTLAIKVGITPTPPWVNLLGLTVASHDGISVQDVATLLGVDGSGIPDIGLKNFYFSYGLEVDEDLCIRQGFYFTAEIHLNAPSSTGADPACLPDETEPGQQSLPTASCAASDTCLAAVLFEVTTTGSNPGFTAAAFIGGFQIGPLIIDDTEIELTIKLQEQRFRFKGGGTLLDPTGVTDDEWASGSLEVEFSNNGGDVSLYINCEVSIGDGDILEASVTGNVAINFSLLTAATPEAFLEFFNSVEFDLTVTLRSTALTNLGQTISEGLQPVAEWAEEAGTELEGAYEDALAYFTSDCATFVTACNDHNLSQTAFTNAAAYLEAVLDATDSAITGAAVIWPDCALTIPAQEECANNFAAQARAANEAVISYNGGSDYIAMFGLHSSVTQYREYDSGGLIGTNIGFRGLHDALAEDFDADDDPDYIVNPTLFNWTGACESGGSLYGSPVCTADPETAEFLAEVIGPIIHEIIVTETGYTLPAGVQGTEALVILNTYFPAPTVSPLVLDDGQLILSQTSTPNYITPTCGSAKYTSLGGSTTVTSLTLKSDVTVNGVDTNLQTSLIDGDTDEEELAQKTINDVTDPALLECLNAETPNNPGRTTMVIGNPNKDEGESFTITGVAAVTSGTVTVNWGDGTPNTTHNIAGDGSWSATHIFVDDIGPGEATLIQVQAQVTGSDADDWRKKNFLVHDLPPANVQIVPAPAEIEAGEQVDFTVTWTDPGSSDTFEVVVDFGDNLAPATASLPAGTTSWNVSHVYTQDPPFNLPEILYTVTVTVTDKDGLSGTDTATVKVEKPKPPVTTLIATLEGGGTYALGTWTNKNVNIQLIPTDPGRGGLTTLYGLDNNACAVSWPGGGSCTNYNNTPFVVSAEGEHTLWYYSMDVKTVEFLNNASIKIRKVAPQVVVGLPATPPNQAGYFNKNNAPVPVSVTANDPSGVTGIQCTVNAQPVAVINPVGTNTPTMTATVPVNAQGTVIVSCMATNGAGVPLGAGPGSSNVRTMLMDSLPPTVTVTGVAQGATYTMGQVPAAGCTTTDPVPGSGVLTNASLQITGGNANGAGAFSASCVGAKDKAGNVTPPVVVNYSVVCPAVMTYTGPMTTKFGSSVGGSPVVTAQVSLNTTTCEVLNVTLTSATAAKGAIAVNTTSWTKTQPAANQWQFTMKTPSLAAGAVHNNNAWRVLDGTSKLFVKFVNGRLQLYMKLTGSAPTGVGIAKIGVESETSPTGIPLIPAP